jgi:hypothetical protein
MLRIVKHEFRHPLQAFTKRKVAITIQVFREAREDHREQVHWERTCSFRPLRDCLIVLRRRKRQRLHKKLLRHASQVLAHSHAEFRRQVIDHVTWAIVSNT